MEKENRLEQKRHSEPFVGPRTAKEADLFIAGNGKDEPDTCGAATEVGSLLEMVARESDRTQAHGKTQARE